MKVGIPKEIKNNENRVGMTPAGVAELTRRGHEVSVQHTAGEGSGFSDDEYVKAGARILPTIEAVYRECDMIVKVKEPIEPEYELVRKGQLLFTYFHFACEKELTDAMLKSGAVCLAYETVQLPNGTLPLLQPMSEVAGRMAVQNGAYYHINDRITVSDPDTGVFHNLRKPIEADILWKENHLPLINQVGIADGCYDNKPKGISNDDKCRDRQYQHDPVKHAVGN